MQIIDNINKIVKDDLQAGIHKGRLLSCGKSRPAMKLHRWVNLGSQRQNIKLGKFRTFLRIHPFYDLYKGRKPH